MIVRNATEKVRNRISNFTTILDRFGRNHNGGEFTSLFKVALAEFKDRKVEDKESGLRTRSVLAALSLTTSVVLLSRALRSKKLSDSERTILTDEVDALGISDILGGAESKRSVAEIVADAESDPWFGRGIAAIFDSPGDDADTSLDLPAEEEQRVASDNLTAHPPTEEEEQKAFQDYLKEKEQRSKYQTTKHKKGAKK